LKLGPTKALKFSTKVYLTKTGALNKLESEIATHTNLGCMANFSEIPRVAKPPTKKPITEAVAEFPKTST
jgi:hypothetical protein